MFNTEARNILSSGENENLGPGGLETLDARGREKIYGSVYYVYSLFYRYFGD